MIAVVPQRPHYHPIFFITAFGTGALLSLMVHFNGELARYGNALFSSWVAHGTGTIASVAFFAILNLRRTPAIVETSPGAPFWAYLGGISGAATVMLTSTAVNSPLGLSGTLAIGLAGQVIFSLAADRWGLFGLQKRRPDFRDMAVLGLVLTGSAIIILSGRAAT